MVATSEDEARFEALYREHHRAVLAYFLRRVRRPDAYDATAEVFTVVWRRFGDLPPPADLPRWLYGVASKVLANHRRTSRRSMRLFQRIGGLGVSPAPSPEAQVVRRTEDEEISKALGRLRPKDEELLRLYAWEDLSREDIAELLGVTKQAIDQRIYRAYRQLERQLERSHLAELRSIAPETEPGRGP